MNHNNLNDEGGKNLFNLKQINADFKKLTPQIVTAVKDCAIKPGRGIGYWHLAKSFIDYGNPSDRAAHLGAYLEIKAHEASHQKDFSRLKELCTNPKQFFIAADYAAIKNEPAFKEAFIRVHEIAADCHIDNAKKIQDYQSADEYLRIGLRLIARIERVAANYNVNPQLKASISSKLNSIKEYLR